MYIYIYTCLTNILEKKNGTTAFFPRMNTLYERNTIPEQYRAEYAQGIWGLPFKELFCL